MVDTREARPPWSVDDVAALYALPLNDLLYRAQSVHRAHFDPNTVQLSTLLSIKTGGCPEDCGYCPQAARYHTSVENQALLALDEVVAACARGERTRRDALLHGRRLERSQAARPRPRARDGQSRARARDGNLRDARDVEGRPGGAAPRRRARLLQPQHRHRARVLWERDRHAHPGRSSGHPQAGARGRNPRVLRRHRRDGRIARGRARR